MELDDITMASIRKLCGDQAYGKALARLSSPGIHSTVTPHIKATLEALHPPKTTPLSLPSAESLQAAKESWSDSWAAHGSLRDHLLRAISSFPPCAAGGPGGLSPAHLQDLLRSVPPTTLSTLLSGLELFTTACIEGAFPENLTNTFMTATLIPLIKKDGGVRPVAVGMTLRRLVSKVLCAHHDTLAAGASLAPLQTAFAGRGVCEKTAIGLQAQVNAQPLTGDWVTLLIDLRNAFNSLSRNFIIRAVERRAPHLLPWVLACLQGRARLFCRSLEEPLWSSEGVQQGDPLGPLLFALGLQDLISQLPPNIPWKSFYLDDGCFLCPLPLAHAIVSQLISILGPAGLQLCLPKCTLWGPGASPANPAWDFVPQDSPLRSITIVPWTPASGIISLGCPIHHPSSAAFALAFFESKLDGLEKLITSLGALQDAQIQYQLLRHCLGAGKITYLLRASCLSLHPHLLTRADTLLRHGLASVLGHTISDLQWSQAALPTSVGGLGLQSPSWSATPARLSAVLDFLLSAPALGLDPSLLPERLQDTVAAAKGIFGDAVPTDLTTVTRDHASQAHWSKKLTDPAYHLHLANLSGRDSARLTCLKDPLAGAWLEAPPLAQAGLVLDNQSFRLLLAWRLGIPLIPLSDTPTLCPRCGDPMDPLGDHAVTCNGNGLWRRHFAVQQSLLHSLHHGKVHATREEALPSVPGERPDRPADIFCPHWSSGEDLAVDINVTHPTPPSATHHNPATATAHLAAVRQKKYTHYTEPCKQVMWDFRVVQFHTWGGVPDTESRKTLGELHSRAVAHLAPEDRPLALTQMRQNLSVTLMKQVATQLSTCVAPTVPPPAPVVPPSREPGPGLPVSDSTGRTWPSEAAWNAARAASIDLVLPPDPGVPPDRPPPTRGRRRPASPAGRLCRPAKSGSQECHPKAQAPHFTPFTAEPTTLATPSNGLPLIPLPLLDQMPWPGTLLPLPLPGTTTPWRDPLPFPPGDPYGLAALASVMGPFPLAAPALPAPTVPALVPAPPPVAPLVAPDGQVEDDHPMPPASQPGSSSPSGIA
jgi:hypothetical protein